MADNWPIVGVVSFTDPRSTAFAQQREKYIEDRHRALVAALRRSKIRVLDAMRGLRREAKGSWGVRTPGELAQASRRLREAEALVLGLWHWTEPALPLSLVRELNRPVALYAEDDPAWAGSVCLGAVGASLWEAAISPHALTHVRFRSDPEGLARWARGVCALHKLQRSSLLLWGGTYCLRMEHLQDDVPELKRRFVGDVISEDEYLLIRRAEELLGQKSPRIDAFLKWFLSQGGKVEYDEKMCTPESLRRQVALYLGARDRLKELEAYQVAGVSVRCQPELSEVWGCTGCLLPSFLPFAADSEGQQTVVPTVCEGDIKGLLSCALLHKINPAAPPLFGDLKYVSDEYLILSNCGGSSVFYAANSLDPMKVLPGVRFAAQCQGASGAAVGYEGEPGTLTVARLIRFHRQYVMQLGKAQAIPVDASVRKRIIWGQSWPHLAIALGVSGRALMAAVGSNHLSATTGDYVEEVSHACREAGVPVVRLDCEDSLRAFAREGLAAQ